MDLVNKSSSGDGIPDWKKTLWGLDPTKKENVPGVPDSVTIAKLEAQQAQNANGQTSSNTNDQNLTQTDKFSREFLATVTTLTQNGTMDQATIDNLSSSLANQIQNTTQRKTFVLADLNIINDTSNQALKTYAVNLNNIPSKTKTKHSVADVLQKITADENNVDPAVLAWLDPIISNLDKTITGLQKIPVPNNLSTLHLNLLNKMEALREDISDIKLYNTDVIVAFGAISQYEKKASDADSAISDIFNSNNR